MAFPHDESINGELSATFNAPTALGVLSPGNNFVIGSTTSQEPGILRDREYFSFVVPAGSTATAIFLPNYTTNGTGNSYFALDSSVFPNPVPNPPETFLVSALIDNDEVIAGTDLLTIGNVARTIPGPGVLGPGTYYVWYQEGPVDDTTYTFNIVNSTAGPINDNFANRITLAGTTAGTTGTNVGATGETGEPVHAGVSNPLNSVWWEWTAPLTDFATINTYTSNFDTTLGVYTGNSVSGLTLIGSNDDNPFNRQSTVTFPTVAGTTYKIAVDGFGTNTGNINLYVSSHLGTGLNDTLVGGTANDILSGFGGNDLLTGLGGNDALNGGIGADSLYGGTDVDTMIGGPGNDTYGVENPGDIIVETSAIATEIDSVISAISYTLGANLENLTLVGTSANGAGNARNNRLTGNGAANALFGGLGNDTITGGLGNDIVIGGPGSDRLISGTPNDSDIFRFNNITERVDTLTDFDRINSAAIAGDDRDRIQVVNAGFNPTGGASDLVNGVLSAGRFVNGAGGLGALSGFRYFQATGQLFFDSNGGGHDVGVGSLLLATLSNLPGFASMASSITVI